MNSIQDNTILSYVSHFFDAYGIADNTALLVGLSCGLDSVALLSALSQVCAGRKITLGCCHISHGIRDEEETREDYFLAQKLSRQFKMPFFYQKIPQGRILETAKKTGRSVEEIARQLRYEIFQSILENEGYDYCAVGHHLDDNIETVIMRFFQGAGVNGLSGIEPRRGSIIRPFHRCVRDDLKRYVEEQCLEYRTDTTNFNTEYLRNSVRQSLIPLIAAIFPGFRTSLPILTEKMTYVSEFIRKETETRVKWTALENGFTISAKVFFANPPLLRIESVYNLYNRLFSANEGFRLPYRFLKPLAEENASSKSVILRGYGALLQRVGNRLELRREVAENGKKNYLIKTKKDVHYNITKDIGFQMTEMIVLSSTGNDIVVKKCKVNPPLLVRSRRPGDTMYDGKGSKTVKKLLHEWRVPESERWKIPLITDRNGIIAVAAKPFGYKNRVAENWKKDTIKKEEIIYRFSFNRME